MKLKGIFFFDKSKKTENEKYYISNWAQTLTNNRKVEARKRQPLKNAKIYSFGFWSN